MLNNSLEYLKDGNIVLLRNGDKFRVAGDVLDLEEPGSEQQAQEYIIPISYYDANLRCSYKSGTYLNPNSKLHCLDAVEVWSKRDGICPDDSLHLVWTNTFPTKDSLKNGMILGSLSSTEYLYYGGVLLNVRYPQLSLSIDNFTNKLISIGDPHESITRIIDPDDVKFLEHFTTSVLCQVARDNDPYKSYKNASVVSIYNSRPWGSLTRYVRSLPHISYPARDN